MPSRAPPEPGGSGVGGLGTHPGRLHSACSGRGSATLRRGGMGEGRTCRQSPRGCVCVIRACRECWKAQYWWWCVCSCVYVCRVVVEPGMWNGPSGFPDGLFYSLSAWNGPSDFQECSPKDFAQEWSFGPPGAMISHGAFSEHVGEGSRRLVQFLYRVHPGLIRCEQG